ncbi:MAG: M20/M25/M40 family metallo-hydrolase [Flavobacteriaceae bacterium]|nr:M20/M25/M40 family metallo-hydrolase [Flavobacteriaceae bacterium]
MMGCKDNKTSEKTKITTNSIKIDNTRLLQNIEILASDSLEGRGFSKAGNYKAQQFIANQFKRLQLATVLDDGYIQKFPYTFKGKRRQRMFPVKGKKRDATNVPDTTVVGGNVIAKIPGKTDKTIVITGHLDHLGIRNGKIYNGADDDASGTAALVEIAAYFKDKKPTHTLIIAAVDAEEIGSLGASYLVDNFPLDIKNVVLNINMDMIAHNDNKELYACGLYHYPQLKEPLTKIDSKINLLFGHDNPNDKTKDDWTFSSDHRIFHKKKIPFIYFGVEDHKDYHKHTDTFNNINQDFYVEAVKLIICSIENYDAFIK